MRHLTTLRRSKIAVVVLLCSFAISAFAAAPTKTTFEFTFDIPGAIPCSYGSLDLSLNIQTFRTYFFNQAGSLIRVQDRTVLTSIVTNPLNGKIGSGTAVYLNISPFADGQQLPASIQEGVLFRVSVDGRPVQLAAGRTVYNPFTGETLVSTPNTSISSADAAALCNALQ